MAAASRDRLAWVEKDNGACRLLLSGGAPRPLPCLPTPILAFSPCGALLAISQGDRVQLHSGQTGVPLAEHRRPGARLLAAPKDGQTYAVAGLEDDRVVWFRLPPR